MPDIKKSLHENPDGPSLRLRGPSAPAKIGGTPNQITDANKWNEIARRSGLADRTKTLAFNEDPKTLNDTKPEVRQGILDSIDEMPKKPDSVDKAVAPVARLEALGRADPGSKDYWDQQDARDKLLAQNAAELHRTQRPRDQAMLDKTDEDLKAANTDANVKDGTAKMAAAKALLSQHDGIIIAHHDTSGLTTEAGHMAELKKAGVDTIYTEQLRNDGHQPMVDDYLQTGRMDPRLDTYLRRQHQLGSSGLRNTIEAARTNDVHVQGIDGYPARAAVHRSPAPQDGGLHTRVGMLNTYASQIVKERQAKLEKGDPGKPHKYVMETGESHTATHEGPANGVTVQGVEIPPKFPGLGDILNVPVVKDENDSTKATHAGKFSQVTKL
jgi:hypothetical protein